MFFPQPFCHVSASLSLLFYRHFFLSSTGHHFDKLHWYSKLYVSYNKLCMFYKPSLKLILRQSALQPHAIGYILNTSLFQSWDDKPAYLRKHPGYSFGWEYSQSYWLSFYTHFIWDYGLIDVLKGCFLELWRFYFFRGSAAKTKHVRAKSWYGG